MKIIRKIIMAVGGIYFFSVLCFSTGYDFAGGFPLFGIMGIIIVGLIIKKKKLIGLLLIISVLYSFFVWKIASNNYENTKRNGQIIITALERSKTVNGKYPKNLTELSPNYISSFPRCSCNFTSGDQQAYYYKSDGNNFKLQGRCGYVFYTYDSNIKSWSRKIIS